MIQIKNQLSITYPLQEDQFLSGNGKGPSLNLCCHLPSTSMALYPWPRFFYPSPPSFSFPLSLPLPCIFFLVLWRWVIIFSSLDLCFFYLSHSLSTHLCHQIYYTLKVSEFFSFSRSIISLPLFGWKQPNLLFVSYSSKVSKPFSFPWSEFLISLCPFLSLFLFPRSMLWKWANGSLFQI